MANVYHLFSQHFPADQQSICIETPRGDNYSYANLERESARFARFLCDLGLKPGDRIAVQTDKSPHALFLYIACLRAGFIYLPLNTAFTPAEIAYFLGDARPSLFVCRPQDEAAARLLADENSVTHTYTLEYGGGSLLEAAAPTPANFATTELDEQDVAVILYTSGTTGRPKGAMITHANLAANALALHDYWQWRADDVLLHALPIFHIHGLFVACHSVLLGGSRMIFLDRFDVPTVLRCLPRATVMMGVPTFYTRLLADPGFTKETCRNMRLFISGSAPLLEQTFDEFRERTGHTIL
ncbi:MAG: AMP-binding protein, partial [Deltaproteobacteria bacterium]|nr:AMP-binding protein [Deltaproteobacteria bacterium]